MSANGETIAADTRYSRYVHARQQNVEKLRTILADEKGVKVSYEQASYYADELTALFKALAGDRVIAEPRSKNPVAYEA